MTDLLEALVGEEVVLVVEEEMRDGEKRMGVIHSTKILWAELQKCLGVE